MIIYDKNGCAIENIEHPLDCGLLLLLGDSEMDGLRFMMDHAYGVAKEPGYSFDFKVIGNGFLCAKYQRYYQSGERYPEFGMLKKPIPSIRYMKDSIKINDARISFMDWFYCNNIAPALTTMYRHKLINDDGYCRFMDLKMSDIFAPLDYAGENYEYVYCYDMRIEEILSLYVTFSKFHFDTRIIAIPSNLSWGYAPSSLMDPDRKTINAPGVKTIRVPSLI